MAGASTETKNVKTKTKDRYEKQQITCTRGHRIRQSTISRKKILKLLHKDINHRKTCISQYPIVHPKNRILTAISEEIHFNTRKDGILILSRDMNITKFLAMTLLEGDITIPTILSNKNPQNP